MFSIHVKRIALSTSLVAAAALLASVASAASSDPLLISADSAAVPRFDSTSVFSITPMPVDLGPRRDHHRRSTRWTQLLGPQVLGSFPVSSFGRTTSAGAGVGVQLLVLGWRPWLAIRTELGFTQQGGRETVGPAVDFFGDTATVRFRSHNDAQWIAIGPQFEHGLGRGRLYAFTTAGLLRIRPVQDGDLNSLLYGPTDPANTNTGFCAAVGAGLRWPFELFPHTLLRLEGEYLTRSNARYFGDPPYVSDGAGGSMANIVRGRADIASIHFGVLIQP